MLTDTHCHIYKNYYDSVEEVFKEACLNQVNRFILSGSEISSNAEVILLTEKYDQVYGSIGYHPESTNDVSFQELKLLENQISNNKIIAIGEIGLDYHYTKDNKTEQIKLFEMQMKLAEKYELPVVIHSRDAIEDTIKILKKFPKVKGVIHSFSGSLEIAEIYISLRYKLGINGVVTFKNSHLKEIIPNIINDIVLETDSPYLTPHPYRGQKNSPKYIKDIANFICEISCIDLDQLLTITNKNILTIFDI